MTLRSRLRIMFLSEMCLLDRNSGAAVEMHEWLRFLAREGHETSSVSMSLFDGRDEYPFGREIAPGIDPAAHLGTRIRLTRDGIEHNIFNVGTSIGSKVPADLLRGFAAAAAEDIRRLRPDVVIGYGSPNLVPLRALARSLGAACVFYLANDSYTAEQRACFGHVDQVVTPSRALAGLYRSRLGIEAAVVGNYLDGYDAVPRPSWREIEERRRAALVAIVNPAIVKGGLVFLQIAATMRDRQPAMTFLAVESRGTRAALEAAVPAAARLDNVWWLPRQQDMARLYRRAALLLVPSLCFEAAGRVAAEAQLHGVPVLAHRIGGLPEQVGSGGELIEVPERPRAHMATLPDRHEVEPWVGAIERALSSPRRYADLAGRAVAAGAAHHPSRRAPEILGLVQGLVARRPGAAAAS